MNDHLTQAKGHVADIENRLADLGSLSVKTTLQLATIHALIAIAEALEPAAPKRAFSLASLARGDD